MVGQCAMVLLGKVGSWLIEFTRVRGEKVGLCAIAILGKEWGGGYLISSISIVKPQCQSSQRAAAQGNAG